MATNKTPGWKIKNSAPFAIGNSGSCAGFIGLLDEVAVYNVELSTDQIKSIYAAGKYGMCLPKANVTGSVAGMAPSSGQITCTNLSTNHQVSVGLASANTNWDCSAAGLIIHHGDDIQIGVTISGPAQ